MPKPDNFAIAALGLVAGLFLLSTESMQARKFDSFAIFETSVYGNGEDINDFKISIQYVDAHPGHQWYFNVVDLQIHNGLYSEGVNNSDNYAIVLPTVALTFLAFFPPGKQASDMTGLGFALVAGLLTAPHWLPNAGIAFTLKDNSGFMGRNTERLSLFIGQEMNYYFINYCGISYGLKTSLRYRKDNFLVAAGVRKFLHDTFGNYAWNPTLSLGFKL